MRTSLIKLASAFVLAGSLCSAQPAKRPMTFEDMMAMKRLGETAVSPDGKWLAYSVTAVDLAQNTRTTEWRLQKIEGGDPLKLAVAQAGDSGVQFSKDSKRILFLSGRPAGMAGGLRRGDRCSEQRKEADNDLNRGGRRKVVGGWALRCLHVFGVSGLSGYRAG